MRPVNIYEEAALSSELLQFAVLMAVFAVVGVLWLFIVYLPARTMERWEDQRPKRHNNLD